MLYLLAVGVVALLAQMILPVIFPILDVSGFGSALIPLLVIYASLELGDERAPILAGLLGVMLDLTLGSTHRFGSSALVLCLISALIITQAGKPETHSWPFRLTLVLIGTFFFMLMTYVLALAETGRWSWPLAVWSKITFASMGNFLISPLVFLLVGLPPRLCGWVPLSQLQERTYAR